ncbi:MAG: CRISPR-associated endoribonuclease Cas6 [bacterium]
MLAKICIKSKSDSEINLPYMNKIVGYTNKLLNDGGDGNEFHSKMGMYNLSNIYPTKIVSKDKIILPEKFGFFFFSTSDKNIFNLFIKNIQNNKLVFHDFFVVKVEIYKDLLYFDGIDTLRFYVQTGVVLQKDSDDDSKDYNYYRYDHPMANKKMKRIILQKYKNQYGVEYDANNFNIEFDLSYKHKKFKGDKKSKNIKYHKMMNICPVKITGTSEMINFCINNGLGNFTKLGYGRIIS